MGSRIARIVNEVVARWRETITNPNTDAEGATKILKKLNRHAKVYCVDTPAQFFIAQAIMRGRVAKKNAGHLCDLLDIDSGFVDGISRAGGTREILAGRGWFRNQPMNITDTMLQEHLAKITKTTSIRRRWMRSSSDDNLVRFQLCDLNSLHELMVPSQWAIRNTRGEEAAKTARELRDRLAFTAGRVSRSMLTTNQAVSNFTADLMANQFDANMHWFDAVHAAILAKALNIKDFKITAYNELFHYVPAVMQFVDGFLLLAQKPIVKTNEENLLHNESGPAVEYQDGHKFWFFEGHALTQLGEKIIMDPQNLDVKEVNKLQNEEERRIAIDRIGWGKFLQETGAKVIDYRENWVDNTVEVLIRPAKTREAWRPDPLRMVLSCRSTGRKYFLAVPEDAIEPVGNRALTDPDDNKALKIKTCETAQKWLAGGGVCQHLPYAATELNVIGAS